MTDFMIQVLKERLSKSTLSPRVAATWRSIGASAMRHKEFQMCKHAEQVTQKSRQAEVVGGKYDLGTLGTNLTVGKTE